MANDTLFDGGNNQSKPDKTEKKKQSSSEVAARYKISPLSLTIFQNDDGYYNAQLQRTYPKDDSGEEFGYTDSLRPRDLRKAARLLQKAADDLEGFEIQSD